MPTPPNAQQDAPQPPKPWRTEGLGDRDDARRAGGESPSPKIDWRRALAIGALSYLLLFVLFSLQDISQAPATVSYTEFTTQVRAQNVKEIYAKGDTIQGELKAGRPLPGAAQDAQYTKFTTERPTFAEDDLFAQLQAGQAVVRATPVVEQRGLLTNLLISLLPWVLIIGFYLWMMRRLNKSGGLGGLGIGKKEIKPVDPSQVRVTFDDVAGIDEVEAQVTEIVDFLRNPEKYRRVGARSPKGVLLTGQPGTGKTLLARATAGEAAVPFFSASASEFIEMIVGVGAQRVRDLFDEARKAAPAIIFIDEIDTIGRSRAGGRAMGGNDEREQTLNQILTEMDGFDGTEGVIVMAATNRADVLDPALKRPGRFDRTIQVSPPDKVGRVQILQVHTRHVPLAPDVDLEFIGRSTPGMTGADLANLVNEAAIVAARRSDTQVHGADFSIALEQVQLGVQRAIVMPPEERRRTAYHESGHALLGMLQKGADPVRKISIIPRGGALGVTLSTPEDDRYGYDESYLRGRIVGALGGMAAEELVYGVTSSGAESDLEQATNIARQMVGRWGMSDKVGPMTVLSMDGDPRTSGISDETLAKVDAEARRIIGECDQQAVELLTRNRDRLEALVAGLLEHETLDEMDAYRIAGVARPTAAEREARAAGQP